MSETQSVTRPGRRSGRSSRAMTVGGAVVVLALGTVATAAWGFNDVPASHPFYEDIQWMSDTGISTGFDDGSYRPSDAVTRQSMAAFMRRLAGADPDVDPMVDAASVEGHNIADLDDATSVSGHNIADLDDATSVSGHNIADLDDATSVSGHNIADLDDAATVAGQTPDDMEPMWALINADGTIARQSGDAVSATNLADGSFEVIFDRDVTGCGYSTMLGGAEYTTGFGTVTAARRFGIANGVYVNTTDYTFTLASQAFTVTVNC